MNERILELAIEAGLTGYFADGTIDKTPIPLSLELGLFAEAVWNEAYRKGIDDGWTDARGDY